MAETDIILKDYMDLEKYADAINAIVFNGKQVVRPDKLVPIDIETQYVNKDIVTGQIHTDTRFRDKVRLAEVEDAVYCIFGIENQSTREYDMPLRVMEYEVREYLRQFKESGGKKDFKLKPVITIVMYWKPDEWKEPVTVKGLMHPEYLNWINNNGLSDYLQDYKMHLFTPYGVDKSELSRFRTELGSIIAYIKYSNNKDELRDYINNTSMQLTSKGTDLINVLTNSKLKYNEGQEMVDVCKAIDDMLTDSRDKGYKAGEYNSWVTAAKNMESKGMNSAEIVSILGISEVTLAEAYEFVLKNKN